MACHIGCIVIEEIMMSDMYGRSVNGKLPSVSTE